MTASILIVDDEADIRNLIKGILEDEGFRVRMAGNSKEAYVAVQENVPHLVVLDIWLQGSDHDGLKILSTLKENHPHLPVVMISGHGTIETAVSAIKQGAYDFIEKPFKSDRLILMIQRALEAANLRRENEALKQKVNVTEDMLGKSPATQNLRQLLLRVAPTNSRILLTGEPGCGKDVVARFLHNNSGRSGSPFMALSCATMRPDRLEVELFGSEEGVAGEPAHTGLLESADGGTLLLDEVADMPLETQGKIVRVLQSQSFTKVGGNKPINVDVRIIASTNRNLDEEIANGNFRQDLYYRLNVVPIKIPPLRERSQDIADLASYFMAALSKTHIVPDPLFTPGAMISLQAYAWPGNIRQLRNVMEWILIMNAGHHEGAFDVEHLPPEISGRYLLDTGDEGIGGSDKPILSQDLMTMPLREAREHFEREYLMAQVARFDGNVSKTAQFIGMERSALHRKLKSLEVAADKEEDGLEKNLPEKQRKRA
ncbi:MAG: sigma-54 dependent transcriptional regulator [Alphaproteobacteria bacterium]|nr:sigma-54 dependent transcriptional regulator [Alphaproteobacteria bacterium]MCD8526231.1 sigma-54 dependent transcriptional regulator [Alphaproteobacteria bacterium]MCD8570752.1 sigma-54 dependent transcriptional regulator [Alphaproteobacteria bacterium]